ncbi:hypothetical protein RclHR1_03100013 [Rhizophagus clarus]|uniref:Uncharacterized protein n=1 Tax=Rhizophagus clarus TaxID=94130 RepID=A0A2Z6RMW4_9GLOM|nr:hypothetical protein RclHR1_03100013 [Rhizophagus clarus]
MIYKSLKSPILLWFIGDSHHNKSNKIHDLHLIMIQYQKITDVTNNEDANTNNGKDAEINSNEDANTNDNNDVNTNNDEDDNINNEKMLVL